MLGSKNEQKKVYPSEIKTILSLSRGVYAKRQIEKNEILNKDNTYFALPLKKEPVIFTRS